MHTLIHPTRRHPLTGVRIAALGVLPNGKIIWPMMGGDDTIPPATEPPEGVTKEEWDALGDPGKRALVRERAARQEAERKVAAAHARPTPPSGAKPADPSRQEVEQPDFAKMIADGIAAAMKPFEQEREQAKQAADTAKVRDAIKAAATDFHNPSLAAALIDAATVVGEDGQVDAEKVAKALGDLSASDPYMVRDPRRFAPVGAGGQQGGSAPTVEDQAAAIKKQMSDAIGFKVGE